VILLTDDVSHSSLDSQLRTCVNSITCSRQRRQSDRIRAEIALCRLYKTWPREYRAREILAFLFGQFRKDVELGLPVELGYQGKGIDELREHGYLARTASGHVNPGNRAKSISVDTSSAWYSMASAAR
jgi:hypothetical protein